MLLDVASKAELRALGKSWHWGQLATKIVMEQVQLSDNAKILESTQGNVKMTKKITLEPLETRQVSCILKCSVHGKGVSVVAEPPISKLNDFEQIYTMPTYTELKSGSKQFTVVLCNFSSRKVMFNQGEVVVNLIAANAVPEMIAPLNSNFFYNPDSKSESWCLGMDENIQ